MTNLAIIAAVARNNVIGSRNKLPWSIPADLKRFKALTTGRPVIMGFKTYMSIGRPLSDRHNVVISHRDIIPIVGDHHLSVANSVEAALRICEYATIAYVVGGGRVYSQMLPLVDRLELTEIDADVEGDTFFPTIDKDDWTEISREDHQNPDGPNYSFVRYYRNI